MVKATLPCLGWTYHHDEINKQMHKIVRQSGMGSQVEVEDYFIRKLDGMAVTPIDTVPILNKHLRGYVPDGRQFGIASNKFLGGIDKFTEVKIHNGTVHYRRRGVRDEQQGSTAVNKFQGQVRKSYLVNLKRKDLAHFGTFRDRLRRSLGR